METTPGSYHTGLASALTALNVLVASGFSIAGLIKPELVQAYAVIVFKKASNETSC
jgi:hypothetical protein